MKSPLAKAITLLLLHTVVTFTPLVFAFYILVSSEGEAVVIAQWLLGIAQLLGLPLHLYLVAQLDGRVWHKKLNTGLWARSQNWLEAAIVLGLQIAACVPTVIIAFITIIIGLPTPLIYLAAVVTWLAALSWLFKMRDQIEESKRLEAKRQSRLKN